MIEEPRLLDQLRDRIRLKHYSIRTEKAYLDWNRRFILFHNKKHPRDMGTKEVEQFLTYLAVNGRVASSTQNQALSAILFMYKEVLKIELSWLNDVTRAKRPEKIPLVFSKNEIEKLLANLDGTYWIMAHLLYGAGLRLMECLRLGPTPGHPVLLAPPAATPTTRLAVDTIPSLAPKTVARSQPER